MDSSNKKKTTFLSPCHEILYFIVLHSFTFHELSLPLFFLLFVLENSVFSFYVFIIKLTIIHRVVGIEYFFLSFKFSYVWISAKNKLYFYKTCSFAIKMKNMNGRRNLLFLFSYWRINSIFFNPCTNGKGIPLNYSSTRIQNK